MPTTPSCTKLTSTTNARRVTVATPRSSHISWKLGNFLARAFWPCENQNDDLTNYHITNCMLRIENEAIDIVSYTKYLGVVLSQHLDSHDDIHQLLLKAAPRAGLLRWMPKELHPATTAQLYLYFLRPKLEYPSPVWHGNLLEQDAIAIERVQAAVARSILRAPFRTPKTDLF